MTKNPILDELQAVRERLLADAGGTAGWHCQNDKCINYFPFSGATGNLLPVLSPHRLTNNVGALFGIVQNKHGFGQSSVERRL